MKKKKPVRRPSAPTPSARPKADHEQGRDHQEETTLYTADCTRQSPPFLRTEREDQKSFHSWVLRIYNHQPGWIRWLFWEPKQETNTIEM
ncbi:hypothetical protein J3F84DRAFT_367567, partial [Trichoderma pleuroticola]